MKLYLTTEPTNCPAEHSANEMMLKLLRTYAGQHNIVIADDWEDADAALMIANRLQGTGFEAYHQVTADWDKYLASYRLAAELQKQVQRYQLVYKRKPKAGYSKPWLQIIPIPAVVCEQYLNDKLDANKLQAQVNAYGKAIEEWIKQAPSVTA